MRPVLLVSAAALAGHATLAGAQKPAPMRHEGVKLTDVAGTWDGKSMVGPKDSVVASFVVTATADGKGWTMKFPNRDAIALRVLSSGGGSVVPGAGPYQSIPPPRPKGPNPHSGQ